MELGIAREHFLLQLRANGRSEHTARQYERHIALLERWLADNGHVTNVEAIDRVLLSRFLGTHAALRKADGSPKRAGSVNSVRSSVRAFFSFVHRAGYTAVDPSDLVRLASAGPAPPRALEAGEQERLLATIAGASGPVAARDLALFALLVGTGIRLGAALALRVEDVDLVRDEVLQRRTKNGAAQRVFLPASTARILREFIGGRSHGALFTGRSDAPLTSRAAQIRLALWMTRARLPQTSPHKLRHTFAMNLYSRTRDVLIVQRALGHRSVASTLRYARASDEDLRAVMQSPG